MSLKNCKTIAQMDLEIKIEDDNPRWLPGGHIGYPISSKFKLEQGIPRYNVSTKVE